MPPSPHGPSANVRGETREPREPRETRVLLATPPMPRAAYARASDVDAHRDEVFDAWGWCASDRLEWRIPRHVERLDGAHVDAENPSELVFVMREPKAHAFLPRELAKLHAVGYGLDDDTWALAPWAIDDAVDLLFEHRVRPHDVFWLAAPTLRSLVWGLHDWVHFHNHGPFDEPAHTELQCDLVALAWLRLNRDRIGVDEEAVARVASDLAALSRARFAEEGKAAPVDDLDALFTGPYPAP